MKLVILILACLVAFSCQQALDLGYDADLNQHVIELDESLTNEQCLAQMREYLSPARFSELWTMISSSGKNINQLGDYQY
jgi:hypothetical protein